MWLHVRSHIAHQISQCEPEDQNESDQNEKEKNRSEDNTNLCLSKNGHLTRKEGEESSEGEEIAQDKKHLERPRSKYSSASADLIKAARHHLRAAVDTSSEDSEREVESSSQDEKGWGSRDEECYETADDALQFVLQFLCICYVCGELFLAESADDESLSLCNSCSSSQKQQKSFSKTRYSFNSCNQILQPLGTANTSTCFCSSNDRTPCYIKEIGPSLNLAKPFQDDNIMDLDENENEDEDDGYDNNDDLRLAESFQGLTVGKGEKSVGTPWYDQEWYACYHMANCVYHFFTLILVHSGVDGLNQEEIREVGNDPLTKHALSGHDICGNTFLPSPGPWQPNSGSHCYGHFLGLSLPW